MTQINVLYGYISGMSAAVVLQPLDNIKVALMVPPKNLQTSSNPLRNFLIVCRYLAQDGGLSAFYKGTSVNVLKTGISSGLFFWGLRHIEKMFDGQKSMMTSFISSSMGRVFSAFCTNPLSIIESRMQLAGKERWSGSILKAMIRLIKEEGVRGLSKGCLTACYKEGFFAGFYYVLYEQGKALKIPSLIAGMGAGLISTAVTHPFQLIRARLQVGDVVHNQALSLPITTQLRDLSKTGEIFKGLTPRLIKKPLSNTLSFLFFQFLEAKRKNKKQN